MSVHPSGPTKDTKLDVLLCSFFHIIHDPQRIHSANKLVPLLMVVKRVAAYKGQEETLSLLSWLMTNYLQSCCQFC